MMAIGSSRSDVCLLRVKRRDRNRFQQGVSSHAGQFNLHKVYKPGDAHDPARFGDIAAYRAKIAGYQAAYEKQLAEERSAAK
jgi:hypothetical protein